jgi:uncharacterized protein YegJ (DUF2314 family)
MASALAHFRSAFTLFVVYLTTAAFVFFGAAIGSHQQWSARLLASLIAADGLCDLGLAVYLRFVRRTPHRNEPLFFLVSSLTAAVGGFALWRALSLAFTASAALLIIIGRRWLKPQLFEAWWVSAGFSNFAVGPQGDAELDAANAEAVATVPEFLRRLSSPGTDPTSAAVKMALPVPGGTEHVWLAGIRCEGDEFVGTLDNEPTPATGMHVGAELRVRQSAISDWKLIEQGRLVGGFTIRHFVNRMPARQRAAFVDRLPFTLGHEPIPPST